MAQAFSQPSRNSFVVSNAFLNSQKQGAFSWTIASAKTELWNGSRTLPCPRQDTFSRQAEGFALLTALSFLEQYILQSSTMVPSSTIIHSDCDKLGLIQQVNQILNNQIPYPSITLKNNYKLPQFNKYQSKSHYFTWKATRTKKETSLTYEAQLNIWCDTQASIAPKMLQTNTNQHPALPQSYPQLW